MLRAAGVIVEYNPFHNGHLYHIQETKKQTNADVVIAVMSGYFLQRGEPALLSKWARTKLALSGGADLVFELPYSFATQNADVFAGGAVSILKALDIDTLCFGSEAGTVEPFKQTLNALTTNKLAYERELKRYLTEGYSYPKAHALAFKRMGFSDQSLVDLTQPNNILGFSYIKAAAEQEAQFSVETIERQEAGYHDQTPGQGRIASATSLRQMIFNDADTLPDQISNYVPDHTYDMLKQEQHHHRLISWEHFFPFLKYRLLSAEPSSLNTIYEAEEGLEHRLLKHITEANDFQSFMKTIKTKRYTWTRLQRLCLHVLTNATKSLMKEAHLTKQSPYLRLLGMSGPGQSYLNAIKDNLELPLITKTSTDVHHPIQHLDIKAAQIYNHIISSLDSAKSPIPEYKQPPIIFK